MSEVAITIPKNDSRTLNAWCSYDWANSVYSLTISSTIFPVYFNSATRSAFGGDRILFLGMEIENTVLYSYSLSVSYMLIVLLSPFLSGIADYGGMKKTMMKFFATLGSASCVALFFFNGKNVEFGMLAATLASVGWAGSIVFYNAYLPEIATADRFDRLSAKGYAMGYVGSVIQLVLSLVIVLNPAWFGMEDDGFAARLSFLTVGVWWFAFSQISFYYLPVNVHNLKPDDAHLLKKGFMELKKVWMKVKSNQVIRRYLSAFFFYNMGVQTVMLLAATFGEKEIHMEGDKLILTILIIQVVAILGAYLFARISERTSNRVALMIMVVIWVGVCLYAYVLQTQNEFYILAVVVGLVMGGIQSLSRSTYSKLIPENTMDTTSYFSFYDVTDKLSVVIGTALYGLIEHLTGSMRNSALALAFFFFVGLIFLFRFRMAPDKLA